MSPDQKNAGMGGPAREPKPAGKDPFAEATTRRLLAEQAVAKASLEAAAAKAAAVNSAKQQTRVEQQEKEATAIRKGADRLNAEASEKATALEAVRRFREIDAVIAKLNLDRRIAQQKADSPGASQADAEELKAAKVRLASELKLRQYDEHKDAFDKATRVLEHADDVKRLSARKALTERTQDSVKQQLALKRRAQEQLAESQKQLPLLCHVRSGAV